MAKRYKTSQVKRNDIMQKWDDKTRLSVAASKRKGVDHTQQSTLKQIEHVRALCNYVNSISAHKSTYSLIY